MPRKGHFGDGRIIDHPDAVFTLHDWQHQPLGKGRDVAPQSGRAVIVVWMTPAAYERSHGPMPGYSFVVDFDSDQIDALRDSILTGPVAGDINEAILEVASTIEYLANGEANPTLGSEYIEAVAPTPPVSALP